jgi:hypothetical protein
MNCAAKLDGECVVRDGVGAVVCGCGRQLFSKSAETMTRCASMCLAIDSSQGKGRDWSDK